MTAFWRNWLKVWCAAVLLFGVLLAGAAFEPTSGPTRFVLRLLGGPPDLAFDQTHRFGMALLGAVTIGWAITLFATIDAALRLGPAGRPVWRTLTIAVVAWYVIDSGLSIATGYGLNALSNTLFLVAFLIPVRASGATSVKPST